jgi:protein-tyrosine phosphatase
MPLNQSRYILIEFDFNEDPAYVMDILKRTQEVGAIPIVAHAERYKFIQERPEIALEWVANGFVIQVNKGSFTGRFGEAERRAAYILLENDLAAAVASDAHSPQMRTPWMEDVQALLSREFSPEYARLLLLENPARILKNYPLTPVEPGWF